MTSEEVKQSLKTWNPNNYSAKSPLRNQLYYEHFIKNAHKYAELISWLRFYPDVYYDIIKPQGKGAIVFDDHQRLELRVLARFFDAYLCIPRRNTEKLWLTFCIYIF